MHVTRLFAAAATGSALVLSTLLWGGDDPPKVAAPTTAAAATGPLRPGDRLRVTVHGLVEPGAPAVFDRVVSRDGNVRLPWVGKVPVADLTPFQAEGAIAHACAAQAGLARPDVRVERTAAAGPAGETPLARGDWVRVRAWSGGGPPRETRYVLRIGGDGNIRYPGVGLLSVEYRRESTAEQDAARELGKRGVAPAELTLERLSDADAEAAPAAERVGQLPPAPRPATRPAAADRQPDGAPPGDLSTDPAVTLVPLPWRGGDRPIQSRMWLRLPTGGVRYSVTGRLEDVVGIVAPVTAARVQWEAALPDGLFDFSLKVADDADAVGKLSATLERAFGCTVVRERRELPVLVLSADKAAAAAALPAKLGIGTWYAAGHKDAGVPYVRYAGTMPDFARWAEKQFWLPVLDETGLPDRYGFELVYRSDDAVGTMDAAMRPLGLSLAPAQRTVETLVVRRADPAGRPATTRPDGASQDPTR